MPDHSREQLSAVTETAASPQVVPEIATPIIISLGKKKKKAINRLKRGKGAAMDEVMGVVEQVQANLGEQAANKVILPVVVIYSRKQRRVRGLLG